MDIAQIIIGVALLVLGLVGHFRTRHLLRFVADLGERPLSAEHRDRITVIGWAYHVIAAFTLITGLAVIVVAALND